MLRKFGRMMVNWLFTLVLVVLLIGCDANSTSKTASPSRLIEAPAQSRSAQQLIDSFKQAHENRDMEAIRRLVYWEGVDDETRQSVESGISSDFGLPVKRIFIEELSKDEKPEYKLRGVTYRPNLEPVGRMRIEFTSPPGGQTTTESSAYLIGVKDGSHFIATAAPVSL